MFFQYLSRLFFSNCFSLNTNVVNINTQNINAPISSKVGNGSLNIKKSDIFDLRYIANTMHNNLSDAEIIALYYTKQPDIKSLMYYDKIIKQFNDEQQPLKDIEKQKELLRTLEFYILVNNKYGSGLCKIMQKLDIDLGIFVYIPRNDRKSYYDNKYSLAKKYQKLLFK